MRRSASALARSGAPLIRDRKEDGVRKGPGSATHHSAALRAALRPGHGGFPPPSFSPIGRATRPRPDFGRSGGAASKPKPHARNPMYTQLGLYIDGKWNYGNGGGGEDVINPATEKTLAHLPHATTSDL